MSSNPEHVQLAWPLWSDLRVIPNPWQLWFTVLAEGQVIPSDIVTMHQDWVKAQKADQELLQTVREFHKYKQEEGQSVSSYVLKMKSYIDNLEHLGHAMTQNLSVSLILVSLRKEYDGFVQNYNMHNMGKTSMKDLEKNKPPNRMKSHKAAKGNQGKGKAKYGLCTCAQAANRLLQPRNSSNTKKEIQA
ncbi:hypothetical protein Tco_0250607 [Tanacetum coccineum]